MKLKYLMMDNMGPSRNTDGFVVFPEFEQHVHMAEKMGGKEHVLSAGFVSIGLNEDGQVSASCYGDSFSLDIGSREFDGRIITRSLRGY